MRELKVRVQIHDVLFFFLLVLSFFFTRNTLCSLMMVLFFGYTVFRQIRQKRKIVVPFFCVGFLAFILYGALNIFLNNVISVSVARTMVISLTLNLMMIYAIIQYISMRRDIVRVLKITELSIFVTALMVVVLSFDTLTSERLSSDTVNANMLAMLCVYGLIITMYLQKVGKVTQRMSWIKMASYALIVLITGSRKGLIMIVLAIMVINFSQGRRKIVKSVLIVSAVAIVLYVLIMNVEFLYNIIGVRVESLIKMLTGGSTEEKSLGDRQKLVNIGWAYFKQNPWTGYGYDCFKLVSGMGGQGKVRVGSVGYYSHNNYVELLFGGGIIGFAIYYAAVGSVIKRLILSIKKNPCIPYLLAIMVAKMAVEYAYVSYYNRIDAYLLAIIGGGAIVAANGVKGKASVGNHTRLY